MKKDFLWKQKRHVGVHANGSEPLYRHVRNMNSFRMNLLIACHVFIHLDILKTWTTLCVFMERDKIWYYKNILQLYSVE
jgi:hypothetical protein